MQGSTAVRCGFACKHLFRGFFRIVADSAFQQFHHGFSFTADFSCHEDISLIDVGMHLIVGNVSPLVDSLGPYRLPYSGNGLVPDAPALGAEDLLAAGLQGTHLGSIGNLQHDFLDSGSKEGTDMEFECGISSHVGACLVAVHPKIAAPVDGTEMEDDSFVLPLCGNPEITFVPKGLGIIQAAGDAGKRRFQGEGHQYLPVGSRHGVRVDGADGIVPEPVQVQV